MKIEDVYHLASVTDERRPVCGAYLTKWVSPSPLPEGARAKVNCPDCLRIINQQPVSEGVGVPTPRHTPPRMEDERGMVDGVFIFHDAHIEGCTLEVVPQLSGNVEITLAYAEDGTPEDGALFTLTHLDRANLLRALLHDFHYSPERGGPNDDI